ncbi:hypothetical protein JTB14_035256, partial [Gonioctena quinquepunctata]
LVSKTQQAGLLNKLIVDDSRDALAPNASRWMRGCLEPRGFPSGEGEEVACHAKTAMQNVAVPQVAIERRALQRHELFQARNTRDGREVGSWKRLPN